MFKILNKFRCRWLSRWVLGVALLPFVSGSVLPAAPVMARESIVAPMPRPGSMVSTTERFVPTLLKGIMINPAQPFQLDFIVDTGQRSRREEGLEEEKIRLIKYFMASLTVPEDDLWVNLSPFEQQRIIPEQFGFTDMGRDLLAQDYLLKQLTATLMYPEEELGQKFWDRIYKIAQARFGTTDIPVNTFNKVWIIPEEAVIFEQGNAAYIVSTRLKVMLEEDYIALDKNLAQRTQAVADADDPGEESEVNTVASEVIREVILPAIEEEVNYGKNFATLRQIYHSLILASWYKESIKSSLINQLYSDQNKISGIDIDDKAVKDKIYRQYIDAFEEGVYSYIKEEFDPLTQEVIPRKYFSGGVRFRLGIQQGVIRRTTDSSGVTAVGDTEIVEVGLLRSNRRDRAILATRTQELRAGVATEEDFERVAAEWFEQARREGYETVFTEGNWVRGSGLTGDGNNLFALRSRDDNRIIGMASFRRGKIPSIDPDLYDQDVYIVDYMEIHPEFRGDGYGKIVLSEVIRASLSDPVWRTSPLTANPGQLVANPAEPELESYFTRLGFRLIPRDTSEDFVYDSPSLLQRQRNFLLAEGPARSLYQEGQKLKAQPEDAERWARIAPLYEAQAEDTLPGEQLGLFPDGLDEAAGGENRTDNAILSRPNWQRFVPRGIDSNPPWRREPAYQDFSRSMGSNANALGRLRLFNTIIEEEGLTVPDAFRRGAILGFGEGGTELIAVQNAFNLQEVHGVEWVGDRVQSAAEALSQSSVFPNQFALHHANMADLKNQFGPETFDFVYAGLISDDNRSAPVQIAREIVRILQPGGYAFVDEGNPAFIAYLETQGAVTRWLTSGVFIFRKDGVRPADLEAENGLTSDQRQLITELTNLQAVSPELGRAVYADAAVSELLAQSELFRDNPLVRFSAGYRPTDNIGLFGYGELPGWIGGMRLRPENQFYFKALQQHAPQIVAYAQTLLDNPAYAQKKFVAMGRGGDLIYDAMIALTYLDNRYAGRRNDITLIDFSSENILELATPENIGEYRDMFRRQLTRQLDVATLGDLVFVNEVASERNATRGLLEQFLDVPFEYTAAVVYDNIEARSGTRYDGSDDTAAFDWLDTDYRSGRQYQIQAFPVFGLGHQYGVTPFQRFLNQEAIYTEVYRQTAGVAAEGTRSDRAVLSVSENEFERLQSTLGVLQDIARQLDGFVTSRGLKQYRADLEQWLRDAAAAVAEAEQSGLVPESFAELERRIVTLNEGLRPTVEEFRAYGTGESSFLRIFADTEFTFFSTAGDALQAQSSEYAVYDYVDKLNKALASAIFAGDMISEDLTGDPLENMQSAVKFGTTGLRDLGIYFNLLTDTLNPSGIQAEGFELGLEKDAFPETAYGEFLLPYAQVLTARRTGTIDTSIRIGSDLTAAAGLLGTDVSVVRQAFGESVNREIALQRFAARVDRAPEDALTDLMAAGYAVRNPARGELGFDLTDAFFSAEEGAQWAFAGLNRLNELSRYLLEELNENLFTAALAERGVDITAADTTARIAEAAAADQLPTVLRQVARDTARESERVGAVTPAATASFRPELESGVLEAFDAYVAQMGQVLAELQRRREGDQVWFIFDNQYWDNLPANSMAVDRRTGDFLIHLHTNEGDLTRGFMFRINPTAEEGEAIFDRFWIEDTSSQGFIDGQRFVDEGYISAAFAQQLLEDATAVMRQEDGFQIMDKYPQMRQDFYPLMQDVMQNRPERARFVVGTVRDAQQRDVLLNIFVGRRISAAEEADGVARTLTGPDNASNPVTYRLTRDAATLSANPVGGIDLTPNNLNIDVRRDPNGVPVPLTPQQIQDVNINGLYPVIINTVPITNVPLLLGVGERPPAPTDLSQAPFSADPTSGADRLSLLR